MPIPQELTDYAARIGFPGSETLARVFDILYDGPHDLTILGAMPGTAKELAARTGMPDDVVIEATTRLLLRGAIIVNFQNFSEFRLFPAFIELRDSSVLWKEAPEELFQLYDRLVMEEAGPMAAELNRKDTPPMVRVIPVEQSVAAQNTVLDIDTARKIFKEADLITVIPCVCRLVARKNGRGQDCPAPADAVCMQTNMFAAGIMARQIGEKITREDALRRVGEAEDAGLVHCIRNNVQKDMFMCNCCSCCCTGLHFLKNLGYRNALAPSRFQVTFDADACSACGLCVDRCSFGVFTMMDGELQIDYDKCFGCGNCVITCPEEALSLKEMRPKEYIRVK